MDRRSDSKKSSVEPIKKIKNKNMCRKMIQMVIIVKKLLKLLKNMIIPKERLKKMNRGQLMTRLIYLQQVVANQKLIMTCISL